MPSEPRRLSNPADLERLRVELDAAERTLSEAIDRQRQHDAGPSRYPRLQDGVDGVDVLRAFKDIAVTWCHLQGAQMKYQGAFTRHMTAIEEQRQKLSDRNYFIMIVLTLIIAAGTGIQGYRILWPAPVPPLLPPAPAAPAAPVVILCPK